MTPTNAGNDKTKGRMKDMRTETDTLIKALYIVAGDLQKFDKFPKENLSLYAMTILEASERLKELEDLRLSGG